MAGHDNEGDRFAEFINGNGPLIGAIIVIAFVVCLVVNAVSNL